MDQLNERLFIIVPLVSMLCNTFLLLTVCSAKKDRQIHAFMALLLCFTAWCGGSLFMRMMLYPGPEFWYRVSILGIFFTPLFIYNFMHYFTETRGTFVLRLLFVVWIPMALLNLGNVFITAPHMVVQDGVRRFEYGVSPWLVLPVVLAAITLLGAWRLGARSVREDRIPFARFRPLVVGVAVLFAGTVAAALPQMVSLPIDTFVCGVNAICLYYALYTKRLVQLRSFASNAPSYLIAVLFSTLMLVTSYGSFDRFYRSNFSAYLDYEPIATAVAFSLLTMLLYMLVRRLADNLLDKSQRNQEAELRRFSTEVTKTLELEKILALYQDFLQQNLPGKIARVFLLDKNTGEYRVAGCTNASLAWGDSIAADSPLIPWLRETGYGLRYVDFQHTRIYRSMWEKEKQRFAEMKVSFLLPVMEDQELVAITVFSDQESEDRSRPFTAGEIAFLESMAAVLSMALKNASLYTSLENRARRDSMTNLYNRSYFTECVRRDFELCRHSELSLLLISFDDFGLYNELYGIQEGDSILKKFAAQLELLAGSRGMVARYGGKEFALSFPFCPAAVAEECARRARQWLEEETVGAGSKTKRFLTFSAGISAYPLAAANPDQLFSYANMALYSAKSRGKNRIEVYDPAARSKSPEQSGQERRKLADNCAPTIYALTAAVDAKDHYTFSHSNNVAVYASQLAAAVPLDADHVEIVRQAGLLHDIGKIGIPEAILTKSGRLTAEEYDIMKQHVEGAIAMIKYLPSLDYVIPSVIGHHERWDGRGYPRGLAGEQIPVAARCLCIADSFDAMVSRRSYKEAMSVEDALEEIRRNLGTQFDPTLGQLFIRLVEEGTVTLQRPSDPIPTP